MNQLKDRNQKGQVLTEVLIAVAIVAIVIGGTAVTIGSSLIVGKKVKQVSTANSLAMETVEAIESIASNSWIKIYCPPLGICASSTKGSGVEFSPTFSTSTNTWAIQSRRATTTIDGISYGRYFYIENVDRDNSGVGAINPDGSSDPSTQKISTFIAWGNGNNFEVSEYITRSHSITLTDKNWVSGNVNNGPYTASVGTYSAITDSVINNNKTISGVGSFISSIFDTGHTNGVAFNFIKWKGSGTPIRFQLASSTTTDTLIFKGPGGTDADSYTSLVDGAGVAPATIITTNHNNHRYFQYKIFIDNADSVVSEIVIGYSP